MKKKNINVFALGGQLALSLFSGATSLASQGIRNLKTPDIFNPTAFAGSNEELMSMYGKGANQMEKLDVGANALQGGLSGATAGATFGPWGAAIGGVAGAGIGLATSIFGNKNITQKNAELNGLYQRDLDSSRQGIESRNFNQQMVNNFGFGGEMGTEFNAGGTHELNPNGGIPLGIGANGLLNLVEEGEFKFEDYIFSNRISFDKKLSFADKAKLIAKESKERPNDTISKNGLKAQLDKLKNLLDLLKYGAELGQQQGNSFAGGGPIIGKNPYNFNKGLHITNPGTELPFNDMNQFQTKLSSFDPNQVVNSNFFLMGDKNDGDFVNKLKSSKTSSTASPIDLRYVPAVASGIASVTDALGLTNKPDYTLARQLGNTKVTPKNVGNYLEYNPFDKNFYTNQVLAGAAGTRTGLREASGGNRAAYQAAILGADYGANLNVANVAMLSELENTNRKNSVNAFNNQIDLFNAGLNMLAQQLNNEYKMKGALAAQDELNQSKGAKMNNLNNFLQSLGDIGSEEAMKSLINSNPALYYELTSGLTLKKKR